MVKPVGSIPEVKLLWVEVSFSGRNDRQLVAIPLEDFHEYVDLPMVNLGEQTPEA